MSSTNRNKRLESMFRVADRLIDFSNLFDFTGEDSEFKNWLYVIIFRLYSWAFILLSRCRDSSVIVPTHHLDCFWRDCWEMQPEPQMICRNFYNKAEAALKKHTDWRMSQWVASVASRIGTGKKLMLIFNFRNEEDLFLKFEEVPAGWIITTDRRYFYQADTVVFHLPEMQKEIEHDLHKYDNQVWIALYLETDKNHPFVMSPEVEKMFDLKLSYGQYDNLSKCFKKSIF